MEKFKSLIQDIIVYTVIFVIVIIVKTYVIAPIRVNGTSMVPTLHNNDIMILDKISYRFSDIKRFDIVVVEYGHEYLIKRVIGLPGERLAYSNNQLYINGKKVEEKFNHADTYDFSLKDIGGTVIPDGYYFVIGDNRANSKDSRLIGWVSEESIVGKSSLTLYPLNRIGIKK